MIPPYDPAHVETVVNGRKPDGSRDHTTVVARCSCHGLTGAPHTLGEPGVALALAADFNAHRATYAALAPA